VDMSLLVMLFGYQELINDAVESPFSDTTTADPSHLSKIYLSRVVHNYVVERGWSANEHYTQ
jgi:hypothetical protein